MSALTTSSTSDTFATTSTAAATTQTDPSPRHRQINLQDVSHIRQHPILTPFPPWPIPDGLAAGITPFVYSPEPRKRRRGVALPVRWSYIVNGGMVLLLYSHDRHRDHISISLENDDGEVYDEQIVQVDHQQGWQSIVIDTKHLSHLADTSLDLRKPNRLVIRDPMQQQQTVITGQNRHGSPSNSNPPSPRFRSPYAASLESR